MLRIDNHIEKLTDKLKGIWQNTGLYGTADSYLRSKETENSDVDIMVEVDGLRLQI